jgi:glutamate-1-semialdehyde 2,1-aminomutase
MPTISEVEKEYVRKHKKSKLLYQRALNSFASGVSHDARFVRPFPIYAVKAKGSRKWDVDGNEYVDYVMGHGALLTGYCDEKVSAAIQSQSQKAMHMGTSTELEIEWAELIKKLVPSARGGLVRATACGSEATMIAVRLARIYTEKQKVVLHAGSYNGKWDTTICAPRGPPFGAPTVRGIPRGVKEDVIIIPYNNLRATEEAFQTGEVSTIILQGNSLFTKEYVEGLRKLTRQYGVVFMMDEVVSGFKYAAGGAQEYYEVTPDVTILGKIIGGGAPVGAVCGKKEIMEYHCFKDDYWNKFVRISLGGTWNAQPLSIVGGVEVMKMIDKKRDKIYPQLRRVGKRLTKSFKDLAEDSRVSAVTINLPYEEPVAFSTNFLNRPLPPEKEYLWKTGPTSFEDYNIRAGFSTGGETNRVTYLSMINNGISALRGRSFVLCTRHDNEDMTMTENAFEATINLLKENGLVGQET